jgi:Methyltransferase domain
MTVKALVPRALKSKLRTLHRASTLRRALAKVDRCILESKQITTAQAEQLVYGWSNEGWSAKSNLVEYLVNTFQDFEGTAVECGSGLSTILFGQIARKTGAQVFSLEHNQDWYTRMQSALSSYKLNSDAVLFTPLVNYGSYEWYFDSPALSEINAINLILCDGPPKATLGGRHGFMPRMLHKLAVGAKIVVDDTHREDEAQMLRNWFRDYAGKLEVESEFPTFTILRVV